MRGGGFRCLYPARGMGGVVQPTFGFASLLRSLRSLHLRAYPRLRPVQTAGVYRVLFYIAAEAAM